ncbi:MAG: kynureninase [Saprospiraceae bacterium]|nr:kynureninase [Bacteroidia bacterium]NNE15635.1 kynureninase [Saprospiraceae bacterium]NNL90642.1 kynureninase [Saprospiraceae bacterium]
MYSFENSLNGAQQLDREDALFLYRNEFYHPTDDKGNKLIYLCGNSLGLQPKSTASKIDQELKDWKKYGVEGHFHAENPWMPYHEFLTEAMANVVGGKTTEVIVMNTLTVNLHLMMVSFYRPKGKRTKIMIESDAFPSDKYAVESQIKWHGLDVSENLIELSPRPGEVCLRDEDILNQIEEHGDALALIMLGNTNYYTGQFFDMKSITECGHKQGAIVGFDCAHGAGNVELNLHDNNVDFAVWCSYKYLNSGPGSLGGCFVNERHITDKSIPRLTGWWGHNKETRFGMRDDFDPIPTAEAWQLSNPPILSMASVWASLEIFDKAGISNLRKKAIKLTAYLEYLVNDLNNNDISIITPKEAHRRGSQLSIQVANADKSLYEAISADGVIADWREPDVIRVAPTALYNSFEDCWQFVNVLNKHLK